MLKQNSTRRNFAQRLQEVIDEYNAGNTSADALFEMLVTFAAVLREEDELEIYDLLCKEKMTKDEEKRVHLAAKGLHKRLTEKQPKTKGSSLLLTLISQTKAKGRLDPS